MSQCSFLSNKANEVQCFNECVFFNYSETGGVCPFKNAKGYRAKLKDFLRYDILDSKQDEDDDLEFINETYIEEKFI